MTTPLRFSLLFALSLLAGCASTGPSERVSAPASAEQTSGLDRKLVVQADDLARLLDDPEVVVLHVARDRAEYDAGHLPGAHFLPLSAVATDRDGLTNVLPPTDALGASLRAVGVSAETPVVLYGGLDGLAAARGFFALDATGHSRAAVLDGGLAAWQRAGHPVAASPTPAPAPGDFAPRLNPERLATASEVAALLRDAEPALVDARPFEQYTGAVPGTDVERPGHIPGSASLFWKEDLTEDGTLRPLSALRARYAEAGATPGRPVVTYCRTGMQASHAYLVARLLGLAPALYDGSYLEWSNHTDHPIETGP